MTGNPEFHAVLWQNDHILDLGTLGGNSSFAGSINDRGQIMGVSLNDVPDPFSIVGLGSTAALTQTRSFLWEHGKMHDLGTLGGPDSFAIFLNDAGEVAGVSYTSNDADPNTGFPHMDPFLWRDGKMQDLGNFGGTNDPFGPSLFVAGLNNRGEVVGSLNLPGDQIAHAFLWDGEKLIDLNASRGGLGGNFSFAAGLNDAGAVIGAATLPGDQVQHAFRWKNGVMTDLGTPAGDVCSQGENINSIGQIVGASQSAQDCFGRFTHAFLWENGGPSVDLNTLIPPDSSLQLTVAALITDRGEIIGGGDPLGCTNNDACNHVYVLIPCDENHPAVEGCNYSLVDATTANDVRPTQAIQASALTSTATTAALTITSGAPPVGTVGVSYGGVHTVILDRPYPALFWFTGWELTAAGGAGSYHWSWSAVPGSTLPPGLTVKVDEAFSGGSTRCCEKAFIPVIGGTPTVPGIYHVIVAVTDSSATPKHASATYTITILR
jgi:probable HAF family extracellular repeat protein